MPNSFQINSPYSATAGISIQINATAMQLKAEDICYLLLGVDGHATASMVPPPIVGFMLYGVHYQFTNGEWAAFVDAIGAVAGEGGWSHVVCRDA